MDYFRGIETIHLAFLAGVLISYWYYKKRNISVGGSLAVGYLAGAVIYPITVLFTIITALLAYVIIHFIVLRIWLPRPRQIFGIGLLVGIVLGAVWLTISQQLYPGNELLAHLSIVGVIIPGMLSNSFNKQGLKRTLVPLMWMVPVAFAIGWLGAPILNWLPGDRLAETLFQPGGFKEASLFAFSSISVILALFIQEGPFARLNLRTGGYVTAGVLLVTLTNWPYFLVIISAALVLWFIGSIAFKAVPLHGKDRFVIILLLSAFVVTVAELIASHFSGQKLDGAQNLVLIALPAVISNDLIQHGVKRTFGGMGLALGATALIGGTGSLLFT